MAQPHQLLRSLVRGGGADLAQIDADVVNSSIEHRLAPVLFAYTQDHGGIPNEHGTVLVAFDMAVSSRHRELHEALSLIDDILTDAGIEFTVIKGPVSAARYFDHSTQRPFSDIDLVIPPGDSLLAAVAALDPSHPAIPALASKAADSVTSVNLTVGRVPVDIQTDALRNRLTPVSPWWSKGTDTIEPLPNRSMTVLDVERDMIVFLLHQGRDRFRYLLAAEETRRRLRIPHDWGRLEALAREEGIWEQVAVAFEVLCDELGTPTPIQVPTGWRTTLWRWMWRPKVRLPGEVGRFHHIRRARWLMPLTTRGRFVDALVSLLKSALPPDPVLRLDYPSASGPYLWRALSTRLGVVARRRTWTIAQKRGHR